MGKYDAAENVLRELGRMSFTEMGNVFDAYSVDNVLRKFSLEEIEERIEALKKEKEGIRIGDEVSCVDSNLNVRLIVFFKEKDASGREYYSGLSTYKPRCSEVGYWDTLYADRAVKTGEHYDLSYLLSLIRDDDGNSYDIDGLIKELDDIEERIETPKKEKEGIKIGDEVEYDICGDKFRFIVLVKGTCSDGRIALGGLNTVKETFYTSNGWCNCYEDVAIKTGEYYDASYLLGFIRDDDEDDDSIDSLISELNDIDGME